MSRHAARRVVPFADAPEPPPRYSNSLSGLGFLAAGVLVEPRDGARPGGLSGLLVVALGRGVVEEAVHGIGPDVAFVLHVVLLQLGFLSRIRSRQSLIEAAVVDEDRRLDLRHIFRLGRAAVIRGS